MAQCPISPQLTSNCSPLHGTMRHAISLPHTGPSALLIVFLFIFSIPPSPREWVWRYPMFRKIEGYRRSEGKKGKSMRQILVVLCTCFDCSSSEQNWGVSPYNLQRPGTWSSHRHLIYNQQKVNTDADTYTKNSCSLLSQLANVSVAPLSVLQTQQISHALLEFRCTSPTLQAMWGILLWKHNRFPIIYSNQMDASWWTHKHTVWTECEKSVVQSHKDCKLLIHFSVIKNRPYLPTAHFGLQKLGEQLSIYWG